MRLKCINNTRGIYLLYDGDKYIIFSEYYGVVAESTKIDRSYAEYENNDKKDKVIIDFDICEWYGYWALKPIITKGIKAEEKMYITDREVVINYNTVKGTENRLNKFLKFEILDR